MMKSRRDLFEEQLRDLQRDISSLSNKLSTPNVSVNTSINSQVLKNSPDYTKISVIENPSIEEKQNQQSANESLLLHSFSKSVNRNVNTGNKDNLLNGPVSSEKLRQTIYETNKERDEALFKSDQMKIEIEELRKIKQESIRLKSAYDHLKQENDSLRISLESSERIRKQQKELITTLQRSHMTNTDSPSVFSFNSQSTISNRTDNNSLLVDNSKWLNNSYGNDEKTSSVRQTVSSTPQVDGKKTITTKKTKSSIISNPKRVLMKPSSKSDSNNSIYSNNSNSKKRITTKPNNNNNNNNKIPQSRPKSTKTKNNNDKHFSQDLNSSMSVSSISRLKTSSFDSGISSTSIPSILKHNTYNINNNNNNDVESVNSVDVAVAGIAPYYSTNFNLQNKEVSFSRHLSQSDRPTRSVTSTTRSLTSPATRVANVNKSNNNNNNNNNNFNVDNNLNRTGRPPRYPYDSPFFQQHEFTGKPTFDSNNNYNKNETKSRSISVSRRSKPATSNNNTNYNNSGSKRSRSAPPANRNSSRLSKY